MQIVVKDVKGRSFSLEVESTDTIADIKSKIQKQYGHPGYFQRILLNKERLEDGNTLADYKIENDSTLYLVMNYLGGMRRLVAIDDIKGTVEDKDDTPLEEQEGIASQKYLEDVSTLYDFIIQKKSTTPMHMSMRFVTSRKKINLELQIPEAVDMKITIQKESTMEDIPSDQQCPDDDRTLAVLNIPKECTIAMEILDPTGNLKTTIQEIEGIPAGSADAQRRVVEANGQQTYCKWTPLRAMAYTNGFVWFVAGFLLYSLVVLVHMIDQI